MVKRGLPIGSPRWVRNTRWCDTHRVTFRKLMEGHFHMPNFVFSSVWSTEDLENNSLGFHRHRVVPYLDLACLEWVVQPAVRPNGAHWCDTEAARCWFQAPSSSGCGACSGDSPPVACLWIRLGYSPPECRTLYALHLELEKGCGWGDGRAPRSAVFCG